MKRMLAIALVALAVLAAATGCSTIAYYSQAVTGHLDLMARARPIDERLADHTTPPALRARLAIAVAIREFASKELGLPENGSYRTYADLDRPYVVWSTFATEELSIRLKSSCFPIAGCVSYRGFYSEAAANAHGAALRQEGHEVYVAGIAAYSTLGWFDDPLLNTFIHYPTGELARLVFHELAHQVLYVRDDSMFNESFATAVEEEGVRRWLAAQGSQADRDGYTAFARRRSEFATLVTRYQKALDALFESGASVDAKRSGKARLYGEMRADYERLKAGWGGHAGYDRWFGADLNNAKIASVGIYNELVPGFHAMINEARGDLPAFYRAARELSRLDKAARRDRLERLAANAR